MANNQCFYTSFNKAYGAQAIILAESLRRVYGHTVDIVALMVDDLTDDESQNFSVFDRIWLAKDLGIPKFRQWIFGLNIVEAATAVKPFALCCLLEEYEHVTYLDPDICVYSCLKEIDGPKAKWDISLTPHQTVAQSEPWLIESTELESLRFGVYNLGFLSVRATKEGRKAAAWWRDRCYEYCVEDVARGLFTDQKLFDVAPAYFSGVNIIRHPGYNVATWNLRERKVEFTGKELTSNGLPLRFCHFTKATHVGALAMDRMIEGNNAFEELFFSYLARLNEIRLELAGMDTNWAYGFFSDGTPIDGETRRQYRNDKNAQMHSEDPFLEKMV